MEAVRVGVNHWERRVERVQGRGVRRKGREKELVWRLKRRTP